VTQDQHDRVERDKAIIYFALHVLADTEADPTMTARANELAARFRPTPLDEFNKGVQWYATECLKDARQNTSTRHEILGLAERCMEFDAESVKDFANREPHK
jgi:hypothetical protein